MSQISIVTDSSAEIPAQIVEELDITVIPIELQLGDKVWKDGVDITTEGFLQKVADSSDMPIAIPPSVETFQHVYRELGAATSQILSIHGSSKLNATVDNARTAASTFLGNNGIMVLDSEMVSTGLGMLVIAAARAAAKGQSIQDVVRLFRGMVPHVYIVFFVDSLEYLSRSQKIDESQAILGNLLSIKPMLIIEDGEILPLEKVRTHEEAMERLHDFISEFSSISSLTISHGLNDKESPALLEIIAESFPDKRISLNTYGPPLVTQIGPQALGIVVYEGA
jgi:DegV family protein with EDD domain